MITCTAKGSLLKDGELVVGDFVEVEKLGDELMISELIERENAIDRYIVRERKKKIIASNVDVIILIMTMSKPEYKRGLVDRYLVRAKCWNIPLVLVFNKADDEKEESLDMKFEELRIKNEIIGCYEVSAKKPDLVPKYLEKNQNFKEFKSFLKNKTALFVGQSGVGKSKTINALTDGKQNLISKEIGKMGKGAHTTTWAEVIDCGDFYLVDSPGIRSFSLDDLFVENLPDHFPDLLPYFGACKFNNCSHDPSQASCAFHQLDDSEESKALKSRLRSFLRIQQELEKTPTWKKKKRT
jgi:ribosome biogenesis GTPase